MTAPLDPSPSQQPPQPSPPPTSGDPGQSLRVQGDYVQGDKVLGDKTTIGNVAIDQRTTVIQNILANPRLLAAILGVSLLTLGLVAALTGLFGYAALTPTPTPIPIVTRMPQDSFNIAVAPFVEVDPAANQVRQAQTGQQIAATLFDQIQDIKLPGLHDVSWQPDQVGQIKAATPDEYIRAAVQRARQINATFFIYGLVQPGNTQTMTIELHFYVSEAAFDYSSEIAGPDRLGSPVAFDSTLDVKANARLYSRVQALRRVILGLEYLYASQYPEAANAFARAAAGLENDPGAGQEVIAFLEGAAIFRAYDPQVSATYANLDAADAAFARARQIDNSYSRAYLGLAYVALERAKVYDPQTGKLSGYQPDALLQAETLFQECQKKALEHPTRAYVDVKASYGLGQVYLLRYTASKATADLDKARSALSLALDRYQQLDAPPDLTSYAADAHALLGRIAAYQNSDWKQMAAECRRAVNLIDGMNDAQLNGRLANYWAMVGLAEAQGGDPQAARDAYQQALAVGQGYASPAELQEWQQDLDALPK